MDVAPFPGYGCHGGLLPLLQREEEDDDDDEEEGEA